MQKGSALSGQSGEGEGPVGTPPTAEANETERRGVGEEDANG